jgi:hypothetical protein
VTTTRIMRQRPPAKGRHQRGEQRQDWRGYPDDGQVWGQKNWASGAIASPVLTTIAPTTWSAAAGPTTVTLTGTGFIPESKVQVDGVALPTTTYVSATQLTTSYDPTTAGTTQFTVRNPDGKVTAAKPFTVAALADDPETVLAGSIDTVKTYVNALAMDDNRDDIIQVLVDFERAHQNRATLVSWLDQQTGVE